jgi:hypothetical protein
MPREIYRTDIADFYETFKRHLPYVLLIVGVVFFHLVEVNIINAPVFAYDIQNIEGDAVFWFSQHWTPVLTYFFVLMHIEVYPFTPWF